MFDKLIKYIFLLLCTFNLLAQSQKISYSKNISISDGLVHNGVTSILEDSKGYIWIGTYDGLNRYDGYEFDTYKNTVTEELMVNNRVRSLAEDKKGNIWIGTDDGLSIYNYSTEKFKTIFTSKLLSEGKNGPIVRKIIIAPAQDLILCATEGSGLLIFNSDYSFKTRYIPTSRSNVTFYDGCLVGSNTYIFSTSIGLISFNISTNKFENILSTAITESRSIIKFAKGKLLVTLDNGIAIVNYEEKANLLSFKIVQTDLEQYQFVCAAIDHLNNLWLGTAKNGFLKINDSKSFLKNEKYKITNFNLAENMLRVSCIVPLKNSCWVGSYNKGIFKYNLNSNPFKHYDTSLEQPYGLTSNEVYSITDLDKDRVYISTLQGGLNLFNTRLERFEPLPFAIPKKLISKIGATYVDSKKNLWFKIFGDGLYRVKNKSSKLEKIAAVDSEVKIVDAKGIITEDSYGNILLTTSKECYRIILDKNEDVQDVEKLSKHALFFKNKLPLIKCVYADPLYKNILWVGTNVDGLLRVAFDKSKKLQNARVDQFRYDGRNPSAISSSFVTSVLRLPDNSLWVGTERGGICKVENSNKTPKFISFSEKEGLSNNVVKSMVFDGRKSLWIGTNNGLNKFDIDKQSFQKFNVVDGLPFEDFNYGFTRMENGLLLFAGFNGFCYFNPNALPHSEALPKLELGDLKIFNSIVKPNDTINGRVIMKSRLSELQELLLKYHENVFSIGVTSLHYSSQKNHFIKYQLLPINKDWIEIPSSQRNIYFNGLPPGSYTLKIKASNTLNEWTKTKELKITISSPWWKTYWAYLIYFLLLLAVGYVILYYVLKMQKLKHDLDVEQLESNIGKEINAAKLLFFSNISHEIKTPLTLILGPVDSLRNRFENNSEVSDTLQIIQKQASKIGALVNQVHDFQKADANLLKMNYSYFNFNHFIEDLVSEYQFISLSENKSLEIVAAPATIYVYADKDKLEKIFNNILTNAFKHTKAKDAILVNYNIVDKNLNVAISDEGSGIHSADLPHIFERFYHSKVSEKAYYGGSGIGLAFSKQLVEMHFGSIDVQSELGKGTTIFLQLPIVHTEYSLSQMQIENEVLELENNNIEPIVLEPVAAEKLHFDSSFSEAKIFIVEDNLDLRNYISGMLEKYLKIEVYVNGRECLDALEISWPDLILSDVLMPEVNGFELCKSVKSNIKTSHIPVVLLTACTTIDDQVKGLIDGADAYIEKPFNMQHLLATIESILRNRKQLRERFMIELPLTLEVNDNANDHIFLEKLYSLMAENLDNQDLDLDHFAKDLYLNRTHFYQKVKSLTNCTPFELLKAYRLKKASEFLMAGTFSVNEVYIMTGFKSRTHFSKLFKEKYNYTPGKYAAEIASKYAE